jgi:hypothetical protein
MPFLSSTTSAYGYGRNAVLDYDIFYKNTVLLLHMNGTNGSTSFIDSSLYNRTINRFGGTVISTDQYKFGGASAYFNNVNSYLTVNNSNDFNFSTGDWTIEFFCNINPVETDILINKSFGLGFYGYQVRIINNRFSVKGYGTNFIPNLVYELGEDIGPIVTPNTWYHVATARQASNFYLYVNGNLIDSTTSNSNLYDSPGTLSIGGTNDGQGLTSGYLDEVRITKGVCRYPNGVSFPIPASQFLDG